MTLNALAVEPDVFGVARRPRLAPGTEGHATATARAKDAMRRGTGHSLDGRRVLITGAARGIGALMTARRLHDRGARVALLGLEPELLAEVAAACGDAPWFESTSPPERRLTRPWRPP